MKIENTLDYQRNCFSLAYHPDEENYFNFSRPEIFIILTLAKFPFYKCI